MTKVLMYHSIGAEQTKEVGAELYAVTVARFREQMTFLAQKVQPNTQYEIVVTFDDGLADNYTNAYPILKEFNMKAIFFLLPSRIGHDGYMSWSQVDELKDNGMIIGSHGVTHRILTELSAVELEAELKESKLIIEKHLGSTVECLSIPRGFCNQKVINAALNDGYTQIFSSQHNCSGKPVIARLAVKANWNLDKFAKALKGEFSLADKAERLLISVSQKVLGVPNYDRLRTVLLKKHTKR